MAHFIQLKKDSYASAKIAVNKGQLYTDRKIRELVSLSFDQILRYMEEHGFKSSIDTSYMQFKGFYLIERILNVHTSQLYKKVFMATNKHNQILLEKYYLKYQIHNLMVLVRCHLAKEKEIEPYLIGDERRKEKYIKAFEMPKIEDAITYVSKKLKFDHAKAIKAYHESVFELENYLYKVYYEKLKSVMYKYNNLDELKFLKFTKKYVDLINARSYMKLKAEKIDKIKFADIFVEGGKLTLTFFESLNTLNNEEVLAKINHIMKSPSTDHHLDLVASLDRQLYEHKKQADSFLKTARMGSPFYALKYLFDVERETSKLRVILKAKYLKVDEKEIMELI